MMQKTEHLYIVTDENILRGEHFVVGTRTPVRAIMELWRQGLAPETIPISHLINIAEGGYGMENVSAQLGNSAQEQELLRAAALWAADCAEQALSVFEGHFPTDTRPRDAIEGGREFGRGKKRDKNLRVLAWAALKAGKEADEPSKHAAYAATLTASVAYTHTDLQTDQQGIRQARHVLGPAVYAALALETAAGGESNVGDDVIRHAIESAPPEVRYLLKHMPPQPKGDSRLNALFSDLDSALRDY